MLHGTFNLSTLAESVFVLTNKCKPVASYFKSHFVVLSEIDLEEKTIGQCLWLSTKCPRSIHRVVPTSARFQVFLFCFFAAWQSQVQTELHRICCAQFKKEGCTLG